MGPAYTQDLFTSRYVCIIQSKSTALKEAPVNDSFTPVYRNSVATHSLISLPSYSGTCIKLAFSGVTLLQAPSLVSQGRHIYARERERGGEKHTSYSHA
jgi:hypothetical protein